MDTIGSDLHRRESPLCILSSDGTAKEQRIATSRERFTAVLGPLAPATVLLEASTESEWVARHLEKYNVPTPDDLPELARLQATLQAEQRVLIRRHIRQVDAVLKQRLLPTPDVQRLVWVPGIGKLGAYTLVLEIDDVGRFPTVRHFHSYCRLVPGADNSAGKTRHKRSRDGNRYLKLVFHTAAIRAAQYHPEIRREYRRLARRKGKIVARALIAKELASIVYWVLRKREAFNGTFRGHVLTPKPAVWPRLASPGSLTDADRASHE